MNVLTKLLITATLGVAMTISPMAPDTYVEAEIICEPESSVEIHATEEAATDPTQESKAAAEPTQENETTLPTQKSDSTTNGEGATDTEKKNGFTELYNLAMSHLSEILSFAAFIGSLLCAIIYKSGLLPMVDRGLVSLKNVTQKIKESTDRAEYESRESLDNIAGKILTLEGALDGIQTALLSLNDRLEALSDKEDYQTKIDTLLEGELDMLYDIFMSSALPEYEKARVGERVSRLKKELENEGK